MSRLKFFSSLLLRGALAAGAALVLLLSATFGVLAPSAHAASTLIVTTTADPSTCTTASFSLRCAIHQANADGSGDTITFNIPTADPGCMRSVCTISITDPLFSQLTANNTTINGYTQPGARPNTNPLSSGDNAVLTIRLDGGSPGGNGLSVTGSGDTVKGLDLTNFNDAL